MRKFLRKKIRKTNKFFARAAKNFFEFDQEQLKNYLAIFFLAFVTFFLGALGMANAQMKQEEPVPAPVVKTEMQENIESMVQGYPIEKMIVDIGKKDQVLAAFLVSIAKKESNWGKHSPKLNGRDCYNYWGFRQENEEMGSGGHTCFKNPRQAVARVSARLDELIKEEKIDTPKEMVVWKCGYSCAWDNPANVQKWIGDVDYYFQKINK